MPLPPRPPGIQEILDELASAPRFESLEELNRHLARRMQEYNAQAQPELGGLSPVQMSLLLVGDWENTGAMRVARDMSPGELSHVPFFADACTLMRFVSEHAPVKLTAKGNLTRAAVATLVPQLLTLRDEDDEQYAHDRFQPPPIRNEDDAHWLVVLRNVLLFTRLFVKRKGLWLTKRGEKLLADGEAGALYALLFRTFFQQFDLRYLSGDDRHAGLQQTIAFSFHQLGQGGAEWASAESLAARAWLESSRDPMSALDLEYGDMRHYAFQRRVLEPLVRFGLLERRRIHGTERWQYRSEYRRTALFQRVLRFEFRAEGRRDLFLMR